MNLVVKYSELCCISAGADILEDESRFVAYDPKNQFAVYTPHQATPVARWSFPADANLCARVRFAHQGHAVLCGGAKTPATLYDSQTGSLVQTLSHDGTCL